LQVSGLTTLKELGSKSFGKIRGRLKNDVFPWLGARPIMKITPPDVLSVLRRIEARGSLDTAHRVHQHCSAVFRYAVATVELSVDPSQDLRGALPPARGDHYASITEPKKIGGLLRAIDGYNGSFVTSMRCSSRRYCLCVPVN